MTTTAEGVATGVPESLPKVERDASGRIIPKEGSGGGGRRVRPDTPPENSGVEGGDPPKSPKLMGMLSDAMGKSKGPDRDSSGQVDEAGESLNEAEPQEGEKPKAPEVPASEQRRKIDEKRNKDFSRAATPPAPPAEAEKQTDEGAEPESDPALRSFARKFGLNPGLASTSEARDNVLDQFGQIVSGQAPQMPFAGNQPSPSGWQGQQGYGQPPQASGQPPQTPAPNQGGPGLPNDFGDLLPLADPEKYGPEFEPVVKRFQHMSQQIQMLQQVIQQNHQREGQKIVRDFFSRKIGQEGFRELLGSQREGVNQQQSQLRQRIVQGAIAYQASMPHLEDDDCLEMSLQFFTREHQRSQQTQQGRQAVEHQVMNRNRQRSLTPQPGGGPRTQANGRVPLRDAIRTMMRD